MQQWVAMIINYFFSFKQEYWGKKSQRYRLCMEWMLTHKLLKKKGETHFLISGFEMHLFTMETNISKEI